MLAANANVVLCGIGTKAEGAEIDPRATTHLLVDTIFRQHTFVHHLIFCFIRAVCQRFVRNIHGIFALFGNFGSVGQRVVGFLSKRITAKGKRIFSLKQHAIGNSAPTAFCLLPGAGIGCGIIHDHLVELSVSLSRHHHYRTCVLEHRSKEGQGVARSIQIFHGGEHLRTLPKPALQALVVIDTMATIDYDMAVVQPLGRCVCARLILNQRRSFGNRGMRSFTRTLTMDRRDERAQFHPIRIEHNFGGVAANQLATCHMRERVEKGRGDG